MNRPQWITVVVALVLVVGLYAATTNQIFGTKKKLSAEASQSASSAITIDTILTHEREHLTPDQITRLAFLENSISRGDVASQKIHLYHQMAAYWRDTIRIFEPFAWYTAEAARLENSEKSLTFAAHLFLKSLRTEERPAIKEWEVLQAKDLFERSLKLNPDNDSSQVALGAVHLFGGLGSPMDGIQMMRKVADKNPNDVYAQMTLGHASVLSGQIDKAIERFTKVAELQPQNLEAILYLADVYERKGDKKNAVVWYKKTLPHIPNPQLKGEVEARIEQLSK